MWRLLWPLTMKKKGDRDMEICHLKTPTWSQQIQKYKDRVLLREDLVKDDSGSYAVFTEQWSSACQMRVAKIMEIISRLPGCDGQAANANICLYPSKNGRCSQIIENSKIWMSRHVDSCIPTKWSKSWSNMKDPVDPFERNLYGHPLAGLLWERQFENILLEYDWENVINWNYFLVRREKRKFSSVYVDDIKLAGKKQNLHPMWKVLKKEDRFGRTNIFLGSCILGRHSTTMRNKQRSCGQLQNHVRIAIFSGESKETTIPSKSSYFFLVLWHG